MDDEGETVSKTNVRKMQSHSTQRQSHGNLRKPETQAKTRLIQKEVHVLYGTY